MTLLLVVSVIVTALSTPLLAWLVARSVDQERQAERERLDRIMRASTPPSAPGLRPHRRQVH